MINALCFEDVYTLDRLINSGAFGAVYRAYHKETSEVVAVKILHRDHDTMDEEVMNEVTILRDLQTSKSNSSNIVQLIDFFIDEDNMHIVQQLAEGGDLADKLLQGEESYSEGEARNIMVQLLNVVRKLHVEHKITHRDIKPDNILYDNSTDKNIILCDFGSASYLSDYYETGALSEHIGSMPYMAPEIINCAEEYDEAIDMWSIGCTLFVLLMGYQAFEGNTREETIENIISCSYDVDDEPIWENCISNEAKELIMNLLVLDPAHRWTINQALECDWITQQQPKQRNLIQNDAKETSLTNHNIDTIPKYIIVKERMYHSYEHDTEDDSLSFSSDKYVETFTSAICNDSTCGSSHKKQTSKTIRRNSAFKGLALLFESGDLCSSISSSSSISSKQNSFKCAKDTTTCTTTSLKNTTLRAGYNIFKNFRSSRNKSLVGEILIRAT